MEERKQMTMYDFIEHTIKKPSTNVNKAVDKKKVEIVPRVLGYIVRR
ncbi:hypothetical protein P4562_18910 [Lysinibacillus xylanilyticus]|nr:hypothetical protein [Lysinibacillus xylanilyticus]